jgi:hypothetical protein
MIREKNTQHREDQRADSDSTVNRPQALTDHKDQRGHQRSESRVLYIYKHGRRWKLEGTRGTKHETRNTKEVA